MSRLGKIWQAAWGTTGDYRFEKNEQRHPSETLVERVIRQILPDEVDAILEGGYSIIVHRQIVTLPQIHMASTEQADHDEYSRVIEIKPPKRTDDPNAPDISVRCRVYSRHTGRWIPDFLEIKKGGTTTVWRATRSMKPGETNKFEFNKEESKMLLPDIAARTAASAGRTAPRIVSAGEEAPSTDVDDGVVRHADDARQQAAIAH